MLLHANACCCMLMHVGSAGAAASCCMLLHYYHISSHSHDCLLHKSFTFIFICIWTTFSCILEAFICILQHPPTGAKAKTLREANNLSAEARASYVKDLEGMRAISATAVGKVSFPLPACAYLTYL